MLKASLSAVRSTSLIRDGRVDRRTADVYIQNRMIENDNTECEAPTKSLHMIGTTIM